MKSFVVLGVTNIAPTQPDEPPPCASRRLAKLPTTFAMRKPQGAFSTLPSYAWQQVVHSGSSYAPLCRGRIE